MRSVPRRVPQVSGTSAHGFPCCVFCSASLPKTRMSRIASTGYKHTQRAKLLVRDANQDTRKWALVPRLPGLHACMPCVDASQGVICVRVNLGML
eukprot:363400-Chlamydomonas_euryale.AAC.3